MRTKILVLGLICFFTISCASFPWEDLRPKSRRQKYIDAHPELDEKIKWLISKGYIYFRMTCEEVRASLGSPGHVNRSTGSWGVHEQWVMDGIGPGQDNRIFYYIYFENGIVTSWQSR